MTDHTRALLEQALKALEYHTQQTRPIQKTEHAILAIRAELARSADIADEMSAVADQFAHRLALDLECLLADYSGTWYDTALGTLGAYREAMNAIHERQSPTFIGEPVIRPALAAPATAPDELERLRKDAERMREALTFYAEGDHFTFERDAWDTVSDEPQNYWCDEAGTATVEDGTIAKLALDAAMKGTP